MKTGRPRKAPDRAQRHHPHLRMALVPAASPPIEVRFRPDPPTGLLPEIVALWDEFWASDSAKLVNWDRHKQAICRLYELYSRRLKLIAAAGEQIFVQGSTDQPVLNPALKAAEAVEDRILRLEQDFGLTPRSSVTLGVQLGGLQRTLDDLNREANERAYAPPRKAKARR